MPWASSSRWWPLYKGVSTVFNFQSTVRYFLQVTTVSRNCVKSISSLILFSFILGLMKGMDLVINRLEEAAERAGTDEGDMPGAGVRRLATKLRRKLDKTPPRWQVSAGFL